MLVWILKITVISAIIIYLIHNILNLLSETLTVPKVKDLVQITNKNYENIYNILSSNNSENFNKLPNSNLELDTTPINLLPSSIENEESIKSQLKNYLKEQLKD